MKDTSPDMEQRHRALLLQRTGEERLKMGCSMYDTATALVRASILAGHPQATASEIRQALFLRVYGHDVRPAFKQKVLDLLKRST